MLAILTKHWAAVVIFCYLTTPPSSPDPIMGPAKVVIKHAEKCLTGDPVFDKSLFRYYKKGNRITLQMNMSIPNGISDENGFQVNIAVKRNGGWKPNFMKFQGKGLCSGIKSGDPEFFKMMTKTLKAPPRCPVPEGYVVLNYTGSDATNFALATGLDVMPYGEFRISANMTYKDTTISCYRLFLDLVPRNQRG